MAFDTPTHSNAAKLEAADLREQAARLLARAEELDPKPAKKTKKTKKAKD